jgi:hypothetical protein
VVGKGLKGKGRVRKGEGVSMVKGGGRVKGWQKRCVLFAS